MFARVAVLLVCSSALGGCVTGSTDTLLSADPTQPVGAQQNTAQFPVIGQIPVAQTRQMTEKEKAAMQKSLELDSQRGRQQAAGNNESQYNREILELQRLAKEREEALRKQIEGESATE